MPTYTIAEMGGELRQSEIITNLAQIAGYDFATREVLITPRPYSIVVTQDCDLLWDHRDRAVGKAGDLIGVLLYELEPIEVVRPTLSGGDILRRIRRHSEERYHMLEAVPTELDLLGMGLPALIIDFKRCYTMPAAEIHRQCALQGENPARRRCRLDMPFREHLQNRLAFYMQRVGLPVANE